MLHGAKIENRSSSHYFVPFLCLEKTRPLEIQSFFLRKILTAPSTKTLNVLSQVATRWRYLIIGSREASKVDTNREADRGRPVHDFVDKVDMESADEFVR